MYRNGLDFNQKKFSVPTPPMPRELSEYELYLNTRTLTGAAFTQASNAFHKECWTNMGMGA